jgi:hypothetical protein
MVVIRPSFHYRPLEALFYRYVGSVPNSTHAALGERCVKAASKEQLISSYLRAHLGNNSHCRATNIAGSHAADLYVPVVAHVVQKWGGVCRVSKQDCDGTKNQFNAGSHDSSHESRHAHVFRVCRVNFCERHNDWPRLLAMVRLLFCDYTIAYLAPRQ